MTSVEIIHETIAKMRQRVREIDSLIARMERERISVYAVGGTRVFRQVRVCRKTKRGKND